MSPATDPAGPVTSTGLLTYGAPLLLIALSGADAILGFSDRLAGWPFLASLILLGMPHGAADLMVSARLSRGAGWAALVADFVPYVLLLIACAGLVAVAPRLSLAGFAVVTFLHFGASDLQFFSHRARRPPAAALASSAMGRAAIVLGLPFYASAESSVRVVNRLLELLGSTPWDGDPMVARALGGTAAGLGLLAVVASWVARRPWCGAGGRREVFEEAVETAGLGIGLATLNPLFAMGIYFLAWHSARHLRELCAFLWPGEDFESPSRLLRGVVSIHLSSTPLLLPTLIVFGAMAAALARPRDVTDMAILIIAIFVAVTLPHHLQILRMFRSGEAPSPSGRASRRASVVPGVCIRRP